MGHLSGEIEAAASLWPEVARGVASAVAAAPGGRTLGEVGVVTGEAPILASFGARRDLVAARVLAALTAGASHRRPTVWLALHDGVYLASAVDPDRAFALEAERLAAIVRSGLATQVIAGEATPRSGHILLRLDAYAAPAALRALLHTARRQLGAVRGWQSAR